MRSGAKPVSMFHDYYKILNVPFNSTPDEIKRAYWAKAKIHHPDVNSSIDANQQFALISEAYIILSDENKRSRFDLKYKHHYRPKIKTDTDQEIINKAKKKKQDFHYDWSSYNKVKPQTKDMRETHPYLFNLLFLFGMCVGFLLSIVTLVGTYMELWPAVFVVLVIPGIILIVEGFNGIMGKQTRYDKILMRITKRFNR